MVKYSRFNKIRYYILGLFITQHHRKTVDESNRVFLVGKLKIFNYLIWSYIVFNYIQDWIVDYTGLGRIYVWIGLAVIITILARLFKQTIQSKNIYLWSIITGTNIFISYKIFNNESK